MRVDPTSLNYLDETAGFRRFVNWIHWVVLFATLAGFASVVAVSPSAWSRYMPPLSMAVVLLLSRWQLRHGPQRSVMVIVVGAWLMASATAWAFSGVHTSVVIIFPFCIAMAGWILGGRWLTAMAFFSIVYLAGLGVAEIAGVFHPTPRSPAGMVTVTIVVLIGITSFLAYAARQSLLNSRNRALQLSASLAQQHADVIQRERDLNLLLNNVPAGIASFDPHGRLRRCNAQYARSLGLDPHAIVGKLFTDYLPREVTEQVLPHWDKALIGSAQNYRRTHRDPETGEMRWVDVSVLPDYENSELMGLFAVFLDVTDKVHAEQEIRALNADLEQRVAKRTRELAQAMERLQESHEELARSQARATLSVLVASVSHELSTPIGNSLLVANTLADLSTQLQHQLETGQLKKSTLLELNSALANGGQLLVSNLDRAKTLLRNFKQVSADQASEQRRSFDLAEVVSEVVSSLSPSLKNKPHQVVQAIAPGILMDSFPGPLGQVVINLVNNAYLHAFEGRSDGVLTIGAACKGDRVVLRFVDNGVGMSPGVLQHVLDPFFSTKVGKGGTGLGMSIVDSLVRKTLGGTLRVYSTAGVGSTFELNLPLVAPGGAAWAAGTVGAEVHRGAPDTEPGGLGAAG